MTATCFVELDQGQYSSAQIRGKLGMAKAGIWCLLFVVPGPNHAAEVARIAARTLGPDALRRVAIATVGDARDTAAWFSVAELLDRAG